MKEDDGLLVWKKLKERTYGFDFSFMFVNMYGDEVSASKYYRGDGQNESIARADALKKLINENGCICNIERIHNEGLVK